jgi:glycosyltransferase involved in cell wall biosynthesis
MNILHTYDVYIHPSTFEETFCVAAMEALAAGLNSVNYGP